MKRIFVAVNISDKARRKVSDYIETLRDEFSNFRVGWDKAEKLHLTLKFLGDIDENQLAKLIEAIEDATRQIPDFKLRISNTGVFPSKRNARVLWLGVEDEAESLQKLNNILEAECAKRGLAKEKRNFKAHLTVARLREAHKSKKLVERHLENDFESDEFEVSEIVIYESRLQKSGSIYQKVSSFRF